MGVSKKWDFSKRFRKDWEFEESCHDESCQGHTTWHLCVLADFISVWFNCFRFTLLVYKSKWFCFGFIYLWQLSDWIKQNLCFSVHDPKDRTSLGSFQHKICVIWYWCNGAAVFCSPLVVTGLDYKQKKKIFMPTSERIKWRIDVVSLCYAQPESNLSFFFQKRMLRAQQIWLNELHDSCSSRLFNCI